MALQRIMTSACSLIGCPTFLGFCVGGVNKCHWRSLGRGVKEGRVLHVHYMLKLCGWRRTPPGVHFEEVLDET